MSAALVPEFGVTDLDRSIKFYCDVIGFSVLYSRPEEGFAYLTLGAAELMLDQIDVGRSFVLEQAPPVYPFGRGMNLQIRVAAIAPILERLDVARIPLFLPVEEKWYRKNDASVGQRQFVVGDPDGYLVRLFENL
ncbi:MAG TPA: VOC family protein [Paracoccaceae bacterium]|nr:VOC family protein [Paracoccaceae bacterium]